MKATKSKEPRSVSDNQRREFIHRVGAVGLSAPVTALLLSVTRKKAKADRSGYGNSEEENWPENYKEDPPYFESNGGVSQFEPSDSYVESDRGERNVIFGSQGPDHGGKGGPGI